VTLANERKTVPTHGHEHHDNKDSVDRTHRGRKDGTDIDVEKREKELDKQAGHTTDRSLAT
jgi:hypothetical protein